MAELNSSFASLEREDDWVERERGITCDKSPIRPFNTGDTAAAEIVTNGRGTVSTEESRNRRNKHKQDYRD